MNLNGNSSKFALYESKSYLPVSAFQIPTEMILVLDDTNYRTVMSETLLTYLDHLK